MALWDDLHRAIEAKDSEGTERIWLELLESDLDSIDRFLTTSDHLAAKSGGKRQAGILLWMLVESLKEKERYKELLRVYVQLTRMAPDDGTLREGLIEAARQAYDDRPDLDALLEKSGVQGGASVDLAAQAERLESFVRLEPGTYVFHKSGWGVGQIVKYIPERGRCVIDFKTKPGHEMDLEAAADRLERLDDKDIRAFAMSDPKGLRKWASEAPLEMVRQVLNRFSGSTRLRHVKDALVPDAVATSRWSTWWKETKKLAHLDPRFHVSAGRDPVIEYHDMAGADFRSQVERSFKGCATIQDRQRAAREFLATAKDDPEALEVLAELVAAERAKATIAATALGWDLVGTAVAGGDERATIGDAFDLAPDPAALLKSIKDDDVRSASARVLVESGEEGATIVYNTILNEDDPVLANVGVDRFASAGHPEYLPRLLDHVDAKPALQPNLWAWYVRGLRRSRWDGRSYDAYALVNRMLKVLDAVEYRSRRDGKLRDKRGVTALVDILTTKNGALVREAAEQTDSNGARHLVMVLEKNRGIKGRQLVKTQDMILRVRPDALREKQEVAVEEGEVAVGERLDRIYMTPSGMENLRRQRDLIVNEQMPENAKEIARAREFGDLSENAEYHAAREKQGLLQAKADQVNSELARALPLTAGVVSTDAVSVGTRVRLRDGDGEEVSYTLLGPPDVDVKKGVINYLTPLAQALMGRKLGDHVQVDLEGGTRDLEILGIENGLA